MTHTVNPFAPTSQHHKQWQGAMNVLPRSIQQAYWQHVHDNHSKPFYKRGAKRAPLPPSSASASQDETPRRFVKARRRCVT